MPKKSLTKTQQALVDLFLETTVTAKVVRRHTENGTYRFEEVTRETPIVGFPVHPGEFALKIHERIPDAPLSPIYINMRNMPQHVLRLVARSIAEVSGGDVAEICTGIPRAGVPIAQEYAQHLKIPFAEIFHKTGTSTNRRIVPKERTVGEGKSIIIVDDLIVHAQTKLEAIHAAEVSGFKVTGVAVLFDREQGGTQEIEKAGYPVYSALKLSDILKYYLAKGKITSQKYSEVVKALWAS
ncbi:hypothetical protein A2631_05650 [Candidatus Daviesbacteria bacterium RIFCSPHIGHO2_01_FULL_44_29]|uniref:Phosphoribosyltransferase domain-containing protein n=1 Tax=Candidatus Daviesbacteria bacterium RIFCSPHIGHO2_02_FULL_43_12 TaxID=1797776 RepID=A0A1F5KI87_9BACT|nr:MAG: hypothetical protein A2631_05650 [Candidatus Daviesbacteria bacterium RIFCSPHIGHO2_01_FULL_44_29]OGE39698.1 MAG: hypothetical protein A3E86_00160 [Candidatus Daviesbacteria bacterium RIFCSPHIGHO2_12_FULL_47_45]OGE40663.1 MAG: hypothetical protein A3D25_05905 [Candidatus Daviesbacteria bacterium RIFCSPHIGHO2_02_FULL_43_12]OGE69841.1 MAG: hypothetical protein A3B55_05525 [Candidatus Daviesbacteria bacterium RIFCSPLOWO2_01_FULL_43_15]